MPYAFLVNYSRGNSRIAPAKTYRLHFSFCSFKEPGKTYFVRRSFTSFKMAGQIVKL